MVHPSKGKFEDLRAADAHSLHFKLHLLRVVVLLANLTFQSLNQALTSLTILLSGSPRRWLPSSRSAYLISSPLRLLPHSPTCRPSAVVKKAKRPDGGHPKTGMTVCKESLADVKATRASAGTPVAPTSLRRARWLSGPRGPLFECSTHQRFPPAAKTGGVPLWSPPAEFWDNCIQSPKEGKTAGSLLLPTASSLTCAGDNVIVFVKMLLLFTACGTSFGATLRILGSWHSIFCRLIILQRPKNHPSLIDASTAAWPHAPFSAASTL
jgi:hypothetical protein